MKTFWMNGAIVDEEDAKVSVLDHGLLYGDGIFEGIRVLDGRVVDLELHLQRLATAAKAIHLQLPALDYLRRAVLETTGALGVMDSYVRLLVTRGKGALGIDVASCGEPMVCCIAGDLKIYSASGEGIRLATVSLRRPAFDVLDPRVKSLNYLNNVMAKMEAKRHGADEALVLNSRGTIAEASVANVFARVDGVVMTPPTSDGALGGLSRRRALKLLTARGYETREASLTRFDLLGASEVFLTGTGAGVVPVGWLDGERLGQEREVSSLLASLVHDYAEEHGTPVPGLTALASGPVPAVAARATG